MIQKKDFSCFLDWQQSLFEKLYNERIDIYEAAADIIIDTDELSPVQVADAIAEKIK